MTYGGHGPLTLFPDARRDGCLLVPNANPVPKPVPVQLAGACHRSSGLEHYALPRTRHQEVRRLASAELREDGRGIGTKRGVGWVRSAATLNRHYEISRGHATDLTSLAAVSKLPV